MRLSGSSLGYDKLNVQIASMNGIECKPFKRTHEEQLRLISSFDWLDFEALTGVREEIRQVFAQAGNYIDRDRVEAIVAAFSSREDYLRRQAEAQISIDDPSQDVQENVAQDYRGNRGR